MLFNVPVPLNHLGTVPFVALPRREMLAAPGFGRPSNDLSALLEEAPASRSLSTVDELTKESPVSGRALARTDKTLQLIKP